VTGRLRQSPRRMSTGTPFRPGASPSPTLRGPHGRSLWRPGFGPDAWARPAGFAPSASDFCRDRISKRTVEPAVPLTALAGRGAWSVGAWNQSGGAGRAEAWPAFSLRRLRQSEKATTSSIPSTGSARDDPTPVIFGSKRCGQDNAAAAGVSDDPIHTSGSARGKHPDVTPDTDVSNLRPPRIGFASTAMARSRPPVVPDVAPTVRLCGRRTLNRPS
jgi:hypothetical protein